MIGFYKAPIVKATLCSTLGATGYVLANHIRIETIALSPWSILLDGKFYKLITSQIAIASPAEAILIIILLYKLRNIERMMGSNKFGMFTFLCFIFSTSIQLGIMVVAPHFFRRARPGPYAFIFALFVYFNRLIPRSYPRQCSICGIRFSNKALQYLLGLQLMLHNGMSSILPSLAGLSFGIIYFADILKLRKLRWPTWIHRTCERYILSWFGSTSVTQARQRQQQREEARQQLEEHMQQFNNPQVWQEFIQAAQTQQGHTAAQPDNTDFFEQTPAQDTTDIPALVEPDSEKVQTLVDMGFDRNDALVALAATDNNVDAAVHRLLSST